MAFIKSIGVVGLLASFARAQVSSTVTQFGPSEFCEGLSPGGGDFCMTVPAGCYVVPSVGNVVPPVICSSTSSGSNIISVPSSTPTTSSSIRSTFVISSVSSLSTTAVSLPISTLSTAISTSSSTQLSSSVSPVSQSGSSISSISSIPISSSGSSSISSGSSLSPTSSIPISNSGSASITSVSSISSISSSPSITTPPTTTTQSFVSSSTVQSSSGLPMILGGAIGKVTDAQNSVNTFDNNPTTDTQNAAKQAVEDATNAAQAAKNAIDPSNSNFDDLSSKLDELLQDLADASGTLAEAEALADMAAALAPELAAAVAAAAAASALEKADEKKPTASVSATESVSRSSSLSSSSSSTPSACPLCVSCADSTIPTEEPTDNNEGVIDVPGGGSNLTSSARRRYSTDIGLFRRAQDKKSVRMCNQDFKSRPYTTGSSGNNFRSFGYQYASSAGRCTWSFNPLTGNAGVAPPPTKAGTYQTEHVFEAQLIPTFLTAITTKFQATNQVCSSTGLYTRFIERTGKFPGQKNAVFTGNSPIAELVDNLSSDDRMIGNPPESEMVFLDTKLNGLKRAVFAQATGRFDFGQIANDKLAKITRFAMLYQYLKNPAIVAIFEATSARMHATLVKVDTESAGIMKPAFSWADEYMTWEENFLVGQGTLVGGALQDAIAGVKAQIAKDKSISSLQSTRDAFVAIITGQTSGAGLANPEPWFDLEDVLGM